MTDSADRQTGIAAIAQRPDEFESFYTEHLDTVRVYLARRVDDPGVVADLTADIFLRAIARAGSYREDLGPPRAWLIGIARNIVADHRRLRSREAAALRRFSARELLDEDSADHIVERISAQRDARELLASLSSLPTSQREVVELVGIDQLSITEAAQVLRIKPGTARVRFHRARRALQDKTTLRIQEATS
ncbi:MAG: RNA polymerase sigma factor [Microlunatus sp.]